MAGGTLATAMIRIPARVVLASAFILAFFATAREARAEKAVAKFMLHGTGMVTRHQDASLSSAEFQSEPDMLSDRSVRLKDDGLLLGGGMMGSLMIDRTRLGFGVTFFGVKDTGLIHDALPTGYRLEADRLWGESLELRLGREFQVGPLFPYIDLRFTFMIMAVNTKLLNEEQGLLGNTQYNRISLELGPVGGFFIPLDDVFFFDVSGYAGLFGDEKYGGFGGLGVWADL